VSLDSAEIGLVGSMLGRIKGGDGTVVCVCANIEKSKLEVEAPPQPPLKIFS
jgi:hypothetical protein